jgi:hypothetical protein
MYKTTMYKTIRSAATVKLTDANPPSGAAGTENCACTTPSAGLANPAASGRGTGRHLSLLPALALALAPKCPLCLAAWFGVAGLWGADRWLEPLWGPPMVAGLLSITLGALALRAWRQRDLRRLLMGLVGVVALVVGKFALEASWLLYAGLGMLIAASLVPPYRTGLGSNYSDAALTAPRVSAETT